MKYNTSRSPIVIREYGRSIQNLIEFACTIEDRKKRNDAAHSIVHIMSQLSMPNGDEKHEERNQRLYAHLFVMSDFKLDIDSPYPIPSQEILHQKPEKVSYPQNGIRLKHYGRNLQQMISKAAEMPEGVEKKALMRLLIIQTKRAFMLWNQNNLDDHLMGEQLRALSEGKIEYTSDMHVDFTPELPDIGYSTAKTRTKNKKNKKKKKNRKPLQ